MANWIAVGPPKNWEIGVSLGGIWGIPAKYKAMWQRVQTGDVVLCYATHPVKDLVGYGVVREKQQQDTAIWPEEKQEGKALWPLRLMLDMSVFIPSSKWQSQRIAVAGQRIPLQRAFQRLNDAVASELVKSLDEIKR